MYLSIYYVYLSIMSILPSIYLFIMSIYLSIYLSMRLSILLSFYLSILLPTYLSIYLSIASIYQSNTGTINNSDNDLLTVSGAETGLVEETLDYRFYLYRHWSLYESMYHSSYIAAKLGVWSHVGMRKDDRYERWYDGCIDERWYDESIDNDDI